MDDELFGRAIRRAFDGFTMSADATLPVAAPAAVARGPVGLFGRLPRLALPVAVATLAAVVAVTALAPARPAFASWRPVPARADWAAISAAQDACTRIEPDHLAGLKLVGSEQRGAYTMLLFTDGDGGAYGLCLTGDDITPLVLAGSGPSKGMVDAPSTGEQPSTPSSTTDHGAPSGSEVVPVNWMAMPGSGAAIAQRVQAFVIGVSPQVRRVEIERAGAEPAVATLVDGKLAFVWWPSGPVAGDIVAYDAGGNVLSRLPADMLLPH